MCIRDRYIIDGTRTGTTRVSTGNADVTAVTTNGCTKPTSTTTITTNISKDKARKAILIADMTEDFMNEEKKITSHFDHDPLLSLKEREVDLKAMDAERKIKEDEARINLDRAKMVQAKDLNDRKLDQNEDLANLRADTAIEKSMMSADVKLTSDAMKARDVNVLKGRRS